MRQLSAVAELRGSGGLRGTVRFLPRREGTLVIAQLRGLPGSGFYGFHIHTGGSCRGAGFPNTGGHFNPGGAPHPDHAGDLPPMLSCGGWAYLAVLTCRVRIPEIVGRTLVVHSRPDDFRTQPAGDSGEKIGCGVIRYDYTRR